MAYQVALADSAKADANQIYDWVIERSSLRGPEWFEELIDCLYSLEHLPYRCPLAREAEIAKREIDPDILISSAILRGGLSPSHTAGTPGAIPRRS